MCGNTYNVEDVEREPTEAENAANRYQQPNGSSHPLDGLYLIVFDDRWCLALSRQLMSHGNLAGRRTVPLLVTDLL